MMYRYGISYYTAEEDGRKPQSGLDVRLLRPGADWQTGIPLIETGKSGYYECLIKEEKDCGFYEIWDNRNDPNGIFSDMFLAYRLGEFDASLAPYITDLNGEVYSTDITPFPILYCLESICILGSNGEYLSDLSFSATSDSMEIVIVAPDKTSRSHYFRINKGRNILNLNWDTLVEDTEGAQILCVPSLPLNSAEPNITHKQFTNKLYGCFPNPFN